jgi:hypothetical protein
MLSLGGDRTDQQDQRKGSCQNNQGDYANICLYCQGRAHQATPSEKLIVLNHQTGQIITISDAVANHGIWLSGNYRGGVAMSRQLPLSPEIQAGDFPRGLL